MTPYDGALNRVITLVRGAQITRELPERPVKYTVTVPYADGTVIQSDAHYTEYEGERYEVVKKDGLISGDPMNHYTS